MRLLVTRPEPDNARTAGALRALGHEALLAPMLRIEFVADADLGTPPWAGILLTSANGARAMAGHPGFGGLRALPVLAVGHGSAEAACGAGFADVTSAAGDADDLARLAAARFAGTQRPLLYLAGMDRSGDLAGTLAAEGIAVRTAVVYRAATAANFPVAVGDALAANRIGGVVHFSRRSVESYVACGRAIGAAALRPIHYCLSERAAEPLRRAGAADIRVAGRPDEAALLELVAPGVMPMPGSNRLV